MHSRGFNLVLGWAVVMVCSLAQPGWAQQADNADGGLGRLALTYQGVDRCVFCHESPQANVREDVLKFVTLKEMTVWSGEDKHYRALTNIRDTELGQQMCRILGIDVQNLAAAKQCVSCHSNPHWVQNDGLVAADPRRPDLQTGVTCESCHGPSGGWDSLHTNSAVWRVAKPDQKASLGMWDVRNVVTRARICYSCHIGDASEGKVVTHEMYAAGHPPLPSVELETFSHAMPPHWRAHKAKPDFEGRVQYEQANRVSREESQRLRNLVLGAAVAYQASMKLVADQLASPEDQASWPQLSSFDCYACHHDLELPGWRQARGYPGRPGRPQMSAWPSTLVKLGDGRLAAQQRGAMEMLGQSLADVRATLDQRPFGDPAVIGKAAASVVVQMENLIAELELVRYASSDADAMLSELCELSQAPAIDFESARQLGWAFQVVLAESSHAQSAEMMSLVNELSTQLNLQLPAGQAGEGEEPRILVQLPSALKAIGGYSPADFRGRMLQMSELLQK